MANEVIVTNTNEIGIIEQPSSVLARAKVAAKALIDVVSQKVKPVIINGEQYLEFEDWQTAGQFYGYAVRTGKAVPVEIDGVKGAKAEADLIDMKTGVVIGGAEAYCMRDEERWCSRPKYEWITNDNGERERIQTGEEIVPWFQLASMAQTRAGAKAFRNRLAWVAVLAGYRPTPAEEMTDNTVRTEIDPATQGHWCQIHNTAFFKRGKMKTYAHPIAGKPGTWCNEKEESETSTPVQAAPPQVTEAVQDVAFDAMPGNGGKPVEAKSPIDMDWLKEALQIMKYQPRVVVLLAREKWPLLETKKGQDLMQFVAGLTADQAEYVVGKLRERAELAGVQLP